MEAQLAIRAKELTKDFMDGLMKVFSSEAVLNITVNYELETPAAAPTPARRGPKPGTTSSTGKKRGRKPKSEQAPEPVENAAPKKRGRKPKVATEE
ncbi:hypothetical protein [Segetibacter sp. 3557_3]|uniref:hypothetical protein n=1 Tax=Segetibacter sp. 3557_3 TaxID=2547429 RepID=UPI001A9CC3B4|nr:hypothetical protein [Segetibacter sp. 3557_3]